MNLSALRSFCKFPSKGKTSTLSKKNLSPSFPKQTSLFKKSTLHKEQSRSIALYRTVSKPWRKHDLTTNPEEAAHFHSIISKLIEDGEYDNAFASFQACRGRGTIPRIETYRKMMILFYKQGKVHDLFSSVAELNTNGIIVDTYSLLLLMDMYSKNGLILKTEEMFNNIFVGSEGYVGEYALRSLLNVYVLRERWAYVVQLIHAFKEYGYTMDKDILKRAEEETKKSALMNYEYFTEEQKKILNESTDEEFFKKVVESAESSWEGRKNTLLEAVRVSLYEKKHPALYRGKKGNAYDDEQDFYPEVEIEVKA